MFSWKVGGMYHFVFDQLLCSRIWQKVRKGRGHTISDRSPVLGAGGDTFVLSTSTATERTQKRLRKTRPNRSYEQQIDFF